MRKRMFGHLWGVIVIIAFAVLLMSSCIISVITISLVQLEIITSPGTVMAFSSLMIASVGIGTVISGFAAKKFAMPIVNLSKATQEVAKGNFDISIKPVEKPYEMAELTVNFNKMVRELKSIEVLRNDFVVNVSHEFKTPIAAIEGYSTILLDETLGEDERREYIQTIAESAHRLSTLTTNILRLSKLENRDIICEKTSFMLDEQLRRAILSLESQWSNKNIELNIELPALPFYENEELLMQVWINLVSNAIKFCDSNGVIAVSASRTDAGVSVTITDNGIGMDEETMKHIFEKFYQGDASRAKEGNGLGLPLVKRIIDICGGSIGVSSSVGFGTSFTVTLPEKN